MGSSVSKSDVEAAVARPARVLDSIAEFNDCSHLNGTVIRLSGLLSDCPAYERPANVEPPSHRGGTLAAFLPSDASSNACPGDRVECVVVRLKNHNYFAHLNVICRGKVGLDIDRHGPPIDFRISFSRYLECCGIRAQLDQQASWVSDSSVFLRYFKGRKVHWSGVAREVRNIGKQCVQVDADILQSSGAAFDEPVRLNFEAAVLVDPLIRQLRPRQPLTFDAVITSQGGPFLSWHALTVTRLFQELEHESETPKETSTSESESSDLSDMMPSSQLRQNNGGVKPENRSVSFVSNLSAAELKSIIRNHGGNPEVFLEKHELVAAAQAVLVVERESGNRSEASTSASHASTDETNATASRSSKRQRPDSSSLGSASQVVDDDESQCVICQNSTPTHAFVPCGHRCVCEACGGRIIGSRSMRVCPLCRQGVTSILRIFT